MKNISNNNNKVKFPSKRIMGINLIGRIHLKFKQKKFGWEGRGQIMQQHGPNFKELLLKAVNIA